MASTPIPDIRLHHQSMYTKCYEVSIIGKTVSTVVTKEDLAVIAWIDDVRSLNETRRAGQIVGLDIEWSSSNEDQVRNPIGILQLCVGTRCLIYQIHQKSSAIPPELIDFFSDSENMFVGLRIESNLAKLYEDYQIGDTANYLDLGSVAADRFARPDLRNPWMKNLANLVLGKYVNKPLREVMGCTWEKAELMEVEVLYASIDPFLAFQTALILLDDFLS